MQRDPVPLTCLLQALSGWSLTYSLTNSVANGLFLTYSIYSLLKLTNTFSAVGILVVMLYVWESQKLFISGLTLISGPWQSSPLNMQKNKRMYIPMFTVRYIESELSIGSHWSMLLYNAVSVGKWMIEWTQILGQQTEDAISHFLPAFAFIFRGATSPEESRWDHSHKTSWKKQYLNEN